MHFKLFGMPTWLTSLAQGWHHNISKPVRLAVNETLTTAYRNQAYCSQLHFHKKLKASPYSSGKPSTSWRIVLEFEQLSPRHWPQSTVQSSPCRLHVQRLELQSDLQLHLTTFSRSSGAGWRSVNVGSSLPLVRCQPQSWGANADPLVIQVWKSKRTCT